MLHALLMFTLLASWPWWEGERDERVNIEVVGIIPAIFLEGANVSWHGAQGYASFGCVPADHFASHSVSSTVGTNRGTSQLVLETPDEKRKREALGSWEEVQM